MKTETRLFEIQGNHLQEFRQGRQVVPATPRAGTCAPSFPVRPAASFVVRDRTGARLCLLRG